LAEGLSLLRRIDTGESDSVLLTAAVEQRDRIAVSNRYPALEDFGRGGETPAS
jgi:hypothetical protein